MPKCVICDAGAARDAVMFCAQCGKPLCEMHAIGGRYCSPECQHIVEEDKQRAARTDHSAQVAQRSMMMKILIAIIIIIALIAAYFLGYLPFELPGL